MRVSDENALDDLESPFGGVLAFSREQAAVVRSECAAAVLADEERASLCLEADNGVAFIPRPVGNNAFGSSSARLGQPGRRDDARVRFAQALSAVPDSPELDLVPIVFV